MRTQHIYIEEYDWTIIICYNVNITDIASIMKILKAIDCNYSYAKAIYNHIAKNRNNTGLTYSDSASHLCLVIVEHTSDDSQFLNTIVHELYHVTCKICSNYNINIDTEYGAYLIGDIVMKCYRYIRKHY